MFIDKLIDKIKELGNPTVAGLDPKLEYIPEYILDKAFHEFGKNEKGAAEAILEFNKGLIDGLCEIVPAVKPQLAYYEMYGIEGLIALRKTIAYAKEKGMLVILDGKRNDIGSTAEAYSAAFLGKTKIGDQMMTMFEGDALTVNPYFGIDGVQPFINDCNKYNKGIFILVKTSNQSSGQLQDLKTEDGRTIYEIMAKYVDEWGSSEVGKYGYSSVGAVVGATYPMQAESLRKIMPNAYFLVPGYGAQGGSAKDVAVSFNSDGLGAIINASRSIMCAYKSEMWKNTYEPEKYAEAAKAEAIRMRDDIIHAVTNSILGTVTEKV